MNRASLCGPSAHEFVTLRFVSPSGSAEQTPLRTIEVRASLPLPSVGETVTLRDEQGGSTRYEVLEKDLSYQDGSRCVVTLAVGSETPP